MKLNFDELLTKKKHKKIIKFRVIPIDEPIKFSIRLCKGTKVKRIGNKLIFDNKAKIIIKP